MTNLKYASLDQALQGAYNQASQGKGRERHADEENFENQKICVINRWIADSPVAGALFQAIKKSVESSRLSPSSAIRELQGAINYLAAAIILLEEGMPEEEPNYVGTNLYKEQADSAEKTDSNRKLCSNCKYSFVRRDEMPCKKCYRLEVKPHFTLPG